MKLTGPQKTHLKQRLQWRHRRLEWEAGASHKPKEPDSIKKARRMVERWDKKRRQEINRRQSRISAISERLTEVMLFQDPAIALAAVKLFEKADVKDLLADPEAADYLIECAIKGRPYRPSRG